MGKRRRRSLQGRKEGGGEEVSSTFRGRTLVLSEDRAGLVMLTCRCADGGGRGKPEQRGDGREAHGCRVGESLREGREGRGRLSSSERDRSAGARASVARSDLRVASTQDTRQGDFLCCIVSVHAIDHEAQEETQSPKSTRLHSGLPAARQPLPLILLQCTVQRLFCTLCTHLHLHPLILLVF